MILERARAADVLLWAANRQAHGSPLSGAMYKSLLAQVVVSEAVTLRETPDGDPLLIAGCFDLAPGVAGEIFFLEPPGGLGRKLVPVHRIACRWLTEVAATRPAGLMCHVRVGNGNGQRFVRTLGFLPEGVVCEGFEQWRRP